MDIGRNCRYYVNLITTASNRRSMTRFANRRLENRLAGFGSGPFRIFGRWRLASTFFIPKEHTMQIIHSIQKFARDEEGVTAIEYGLIAALIAVVIIISVTAVGGQLATIFTSIAAALTPTPA